MKLIKATIQQGIVKTDKGEILPVGDVVVLGKTADGEVRQGVLIMDDVRFVFIDTDLISKLQAPILDIVIEAFNQVADSVVATQYINVAGVQVPVITTIADDIAPIIADLEKIKGEL